jgi:preprotein translocase subunit YajC
VARFPPIVRNDSPGREARARDLKIMPMTEETTMQFRGRLTTRIAALSAVALALSACMPQGGAEGGEGGGMGGGMMTILPLVLIFVVFYFLIIRPQQRKSKTHKAMLSSVRRGDQVVTGGGIIGNVTKIDRDDNLHVEIAQGVKVKVTRASLIEVITRPTPIGDDEDDDYDDEEDEEDEATESSEKDDK